MKIAYIFFGQVKNFNEKQFNSFNENVYKYIDSHDVDFHLVTSKNLKYSNPRQQESEDEENNIYYQSIKKYFNFKNIFYDELDSIDCSEIKNLSEKLINQFGGAWGKDSKISTENSLKQIYSLEFFYNQFSKLDKNYDLYIFSRSDLFHTHPIDISQFSDDYDILVPYYDNLPQIDHGWFGGVNDRFAVIKNKEAMKSYCCRYSRLKKSPEFYHAEKYLMKCIREDNLKIGKIHNFELRFVRGNGKITDQIGIYPDKSMNVKLKNISKSYFINLDRRVDRLNHMLINLPFFAERFSAIDCNAIELNDEVKMLFPKTWKERTKAEICCALSHYKLWKKLSEDSESRNYLILEDDTVFKDGFDEFWNVAYHEKFDENAWITYLGGCQPWNKIKYTEVLEKHNDLFLRVKKNDYFIQNDHFWHMNANSYIISKEAAVFLCKYCEQVGMDKAVDVFMISLVNKIDYKKILHINPLMTYQLHEENNNPEPDKNSDLRHALDTFQEKMNCHVCFCCDENLIEYAINPINAICEKNVNNNVIIHFIYSGKEGDLDYIENALVDKSNIVFKKYIVNSLDIYVDKTWRSIEHLSNATNLKLQIPEILKDINRVIYFDIDTIPYVNLVEFDSVQTDICGIAMRQEIKNGWRTFNGSAGTATENKNPVDFGDRVIGNSGVMVLDLNELRKRKFTDFCIKEKQRNTYNIALTGGDQDLINIFCQCDFDILPDQLNILVPDQLNSINDNSFGFKNFNRMQINGVHCLSKKNVSKYHEGVLHFIGKDKPWNSNILGFDFWRKFSLVSENLISHEALPRQKLVFTENNLFEQDFLIELFDDPEIVYDTEMNGQYENACIVYSDIYASNLNLYPEKYRSRIKSKKEKREKYFKKLKDKNCCLIHLSDEHCHAEISHYKYFKHVFRQYYRVDVESKNVTFIPLGYKKGFKNE